MVILLVAGFELTVATMCDTFKEVELKEPNWQTVSTKLGLDLYGPVSAEELYQVWCQHVPSWVKLSQALGKFQRYTRVADLAKKKAGMRGVLLLPLEQVHFRLPPPHTHMHKHTHTHTHTHVHIIRVFPCM